ncbi:MAG: hypothetical protein FJ008_01360 [Chloroflexi bacterium]|nr:hypothetical protein [Chloroflexota bacterium]MBM3153963.1 hypothetical protein [Chloroflexota bacterium]MBM3172816.1 hypothetical protein [Chloroflexota bacterium]MBM3175743.1 hypothetical protein [Chloroflexota bacterium]MBM4450465.1 hypothetical protein [Chloroflexota bacterium]
MESKEITVGEPIIIAGITIIPVITTLARCYRLNGSLSVFGRKQPIYTVLVNKTAKRAFRITGEEVPLARLVEEVPQIKVILDSAP